MDFAIAFSSCTACLLAGVLLIDLGVAAVRNRSAIRRGLDRPLRVVLGSTICASLILGVMRPTLAATPPPAVRIVADVDVATGAAVVPVPVVADRARHTVEPGESLWRIARATLLARGLPATGTDIASFWPRIYDANRSVIGSDPHLIHPGQVLDLPPVPTATEAAHGA